LACLIVAQASDDIALSLNGENYVIKVRRNAQAKRMILRVDSMTGAIIATAPPRVSTRQIEKFVMTSEAWLRSELAKGLRSKLVEPGSLLPFQGVDHDIIFSDTPPRGVRLDAGSIIVGGPIDQAPARLLRWLKAEAKTHLSLDAKHYANQLQVSFSKVGVGDTKSRWGSCSSSGGLRFNWRLILAPMEIRRYVAAHEVSHLLEMNHSDRFWSHVETCDPSYRAHRRWLKSKGSDLMRYRFTCPQTGV
jgi:predicted metal-dependent hydrolase